MPNRTVVRNQRLQANRAAFQRRKRREGWAIAGIVLWCLVCLAGAIYFDVFYFLIGGIVEAVNAAKANPTNTHALVVGIIRALCTGLGFFVAFLLAFAGSKFIADRA